MRIALLGTRGIPARYGGFETFAEELSARLVERGHSVTVYGRHRFGDKKPQPSSHRGVNLTTSPTIMHKYLETPIHALTSFIDLWSKKFDVVLLCNAANAPFSWLVNLRRLPLIINVDGIERHRSKWNSLGKLWYRLGEYSSVLFANRIVADADVIADYYRETYRCSPVVIPYGVHPIYHPAGETLQKFNVKSRGYILYVSRLEPENNALGVIQAYSRLKTELPLVIVGDAPYAEEYKNKLREAASDKVIFTGFQFEGAYQELQSNAYIYIQATEVGGTHPALIEAMSYGNCVIANGTPENIEVVGDATVVYRKNDFNHLTECMNELLISSAKVKHLGELARTRALEKYSWEEVVKRYEDLFLELLRK